MTKAVTDIWRRRALLRYFVGLLLTSSYRTKSFGFLWALIDPLMFMVVYYIVFAKIMANRPPEFMLHIYIGVVSMKFLSASLAQCSSILKGQAALIKEISFPKTVLPLAVVSARLFDLAAAWVMAVVIGLIFHITPNFCWLLIPFFVLIQAMFALGLGFITSYLGVFFADIENVLDFGLRFWFYMSPILYSLQDIYKKTQHHPVMGDLFLLNPMTSILQLYEIPVFDAQIPDIRYLLRAAAAAVVALVVGLYVFTRAEGQVGKYI